MKRILNTLVVLTMVSNASLAQAIQYESDIVPTIKEIDRELEYKKQEQEQSSINRKEQILHIENRVKETAGQMQVLQKALKSRDASKHIESESIMRQVNIALGAFVMLGMGTTLFIVLKKWPHKLVAAIPAVGGFILLENLTNYYSQVERMSKTEIATELINKERELKELLYILESLKNN